MTQRTGPALRPRAERRNEWRALRRFLKGGRSEIGTHPYVPPQRVLMARERRALLQSVPTI